MNLKACPICGQQFDDVPEVYVSEYEPFTSIGLDAMRGLSAWGVYDSDKVVLHQYEGIVHWQWRGQDRLTKMVIWNQESWEQERHAALAQPQPCNHDGCTSQDAYPCWLEPSSAAPDEWLCPDHMAEQGFCVGCGNFAAGTEGFDFWHRGLCDNCWYEIRDETEDEF